MIEKDCKTTEILIQTNGENVETINDIFDETKKSKLLNTQKKNEKEISFNIISKEAENFFIKKISAHLGNNFILNEIISFLESKSFTTDAINRYIRVFYENNEQNLTYFLVLSEVNLKHYLKSNNVLNLEDYFKFNFNYLKKELKKLLENPLMMHLVEAQFYLDMENDDKLFLKTCQKFRKVIEQCNKNDGLEDIKNLNIYVDEGLLILEDDNQVVYSSLSFPENIIDVLDIDKLEPSKYILIMLLSFRPKNTFIYKSIDKGVFKSVVEFYEAHKNQFKDMELYLVEEDFPTEE